MAITRIVLTLDSDTAKKLERIASRAGFRNVQQFIYELIRRSLQSKGGRPRVPLDTYISKFASPSKETYGIVKSQGGIF